MSEAKFEKEYTIIGVRQEHPQGVSVELLDSSQPQIAGFVKRAVVWMPLEEYEKLGSPSTPRTVTLQLTVKK